MFTKTVIAEDSARAMDEVVRQLGAEAIVLSTKRVPNGIEVVAGLPDKHEEKSLDLETYLNGDRDGQPSPSREKFKDLLRQAKTGNYDEMDFAPEKTSGMTTADFLTKRTEDAQDDALADTRVSTSEPIKKPTGKIDITSTETTHSPASTIGVAPTDSVRLGAIYESLREIKDFMRSDMVSCELPVDKASRNLMLQFRMKGFSAPVVNDFSENTENATTAVDAEVLFSTYLADKLASHDEILQQKRVSIALVGGSGVGKTTMLVKMAARKKLLDPNAKIAFVSTDTSRIGATEQLRVCSKILNIPVFEANNAEQLVELLETVDPSVNLFFDMPSRLDVSKDCLDLLEAVADRINLKKMMALSPTMSLPAINKVVDMFKGYADTVVLTKLDECDTIGEMASALVTHRMKVAYMSNGCDVVDGLHVANNTTIKGQLYHYLCEEHAPV